MSADANTTQRQDQPPGDRHATGTDRPDTERTSQPRNGRSK